MVMRWFATFFLHVTRSLNDRTAAPATMSLSTQAYDRERAGWRVPPDRITSQRAMTQVQTLPSIPEHANGMPFGCE